MKRLLATAAITLSVVLGSLGFAASAAAAPAHKAVTKTATVAAAPYKLPASYQAVYCWNNGTYWVAQRASFPDYYAQPSVVAMYSSLYGTGTMYCTP